MLVPEFCSCQGRNLPLSHLKWGSQCTLTIDYCKLGIEKELIIAQWWGGGWEQLQQNRSAGTENPTAQRARWWRPTATRARMLKSIALRTMCWNPIASTVVNCTNDIIVEATETTTKSMAPRQGYWNQLHKYVEKTRYRSKRVGNASGIKMLNIEISYKKVAIKVL